MELETKMETETEIKVLVTLCDYTCTRVVAFYGSSQDKLKAAILEEFADVLNDGDEISHHGLTKSIIWKGKETFVNLKLDESITDGCELNVVLNLAREKASPLLSSPPSPTLSDTDLVGPPENECEICLETTSLPEPLDGSEEGGQGAIFPGNLIWNKSTLNVCFLNPIPSDWSYSGHKNTVVTDGLSHFIDKSDILTLANHWTTKLPLSISQEKRDKVPKFVEVSDPQQSDIRIWFRTSGGCSTKVGTKANSKPKGGKEENQTMYLNLGGCDDRHKEHLVMHEFGHALGLGHEHQRAVFWISMKKFFRPKVVEKFFGDLFKRDVASYGSVSGLSSEYDPHSIMHYWFDRAWLQKKYNSLDKVRGLPTKVKSGDRGITEDERLILEGFYQRTRERGVADELSEKDLEYIVKAYNDILGSSTSTPPRQNGHTNGHGAQCPPVITSKGGVTLKTNNSASDAQSGGVKLNLNKHHQILYESARGARNKWWSLGSKLGVDPIELNSIKDNKDGADTNFRNMLIKWLQSGKNCYLHIVLDALKSPGVEFDYLCDDVKQAVLNSPGQSSTPTAPAGRKRERIVPGKASGEVPELTQSNLVEMLRELNKPMMFGTKLRIDKTVLDKIEAKCNHPVDIDKQKLELFGYIESNTKTLGITWDRIAVVAKEMGLGNTSVDIRDTCCLGGPSPVKKARTK